MDLFLKPHLFRNPQMTYISIFFSYFLVLIPRDSREKRPERSEVQPRVKSSLTKKNLMVKSNQICFLKCSQQEIFKISF